MAKPAGEGALLPFIALDPGAPVPLHRQLDQQLRTSILSGRLTPGQRLPATRMLAQELKVSRSTVVTAFEQLADEGYLECRVGSGTFVGASLPARPPKSPRAGSSDTRGDDRHPRSLSKRGRGMVESVSAHTFALTPARPFAPNVPALDLFPYRVWSRLTNRVQRTPSGQLMAYGDAAGYRPLRRAIAAYVVESRGVVCDPDQVLITSGTQRALNLVAALFLDPGDQVLMEDPGAVIASRLFKAQGARLRVAPVDRDGLDVAAALSKVPDAKLIYVTPSCQYPLGVTLPVSRRLELLDWAAASGGWILEDDEDSEFRFVGRPVPSMQGLDHTGRVLYAWSFSEVVFPSLRLGVLVVPPDLVEAFAAASALIDRGSPTWPQAVLAEFINDGYFASHIRRMRNAYAARKEALLEALDAELAGLLDPTPVESGLRIAARLPKGLDDRAAERAAAAHGISCYALSHYCRRRNDLQGLLLGFACTPERQIPDATRTLAQALEGLRRDGAA